MTHDTFCRTQFGESICTCKPQKPEPREVWHNATAEELFKSLIPGYDGGANK